MTRHEYSVHIVWSQEDEVYIATVGELPGCMADGRTQSEALENVKVIAKEWVETALVEKRQIPPPMTHEDCEEMQASFHKSVRKYIQKEVAESVQRIVEHIREQEAELFPGGGRLGRRFTAKRRFSTSKISVPTSRD